MNEGVEILMPYPETSEHDRRALAPRLPALEGATIGIVNNSWRCMDIVSHELRHLLAGRGGVSRFVEKRISAAQTLPPAQLDELASVCDAVVVGIGN